MVQGELATESGILAAETVSDPAIGGVYSDEDNLFPGRSGSVRTMRKRRAYYASLVKTKTERDIAA